MDDVSVTVDAARIISNLTMHCPAGSFVGLIGPNGSGKSTALRTVYRALTPSNGVVRVGGDDVIQDLTSREAARRVSVLAQETSAGFDLSVGEVVAIGRLPHQSTLGRTTASDRDVVRRALDLVGLQWHTNREFGSLSGGEKQRVLLARALTQEPRVLVLDEPTNHLDIATQLGLLDLVASLGVTVLAALHDLNLAAGYCDLIHVLKDGELVVSGTPSEVLTPALVAEVFCVQADVGRHPVTGRVHLAFSPLT